MDAMRAIAEYALTFILYIIEPNTKKARCYHRSLQSSCRLFRHLRMIENIGDALNAVACPLTDDAIYIALTDGVVKFA